MADNACCMNLCSHEHNAVESDRNGLGAANPSAAAELEVTGPGADRNPFVDASNLLTHVSGTLPQANEVLGNDSDGAAAQASNLGISNGAAVDRDNLLATSTHSLVQPDGSGDFDYDNGQLVFPTGGDGALLNPFNMLHTAQAGGAGGDENENELNESLEEEVESDLEDYSQLTPAEVLNCLYEYKSAYRTVR